MSSTDSDTTTQRGTDQAPTRLVLIRHGESQVTVDRVIGGFRTCSGLSPLGREQTERLRDRLASTGELDDPVLISSNFERAIETAQIIAPALRPEQRAEDGVSIDPGFGEHDPGPALDGVSFDEYVERFGTPKWGTDPHYEIFPGGETLAEFHLRVGSSLSRTLDAHDGRLIVISCHGGVVDAVFRQLMKSAPVGLYDLWTLNTSITEFVRPPSSGRSHWRLVRYNDAGHLAGLPTATERAAAAARE